MTVYDPLTDAQDEPWESMHETRQTCPVSDLGPGQLQALGYHGAASVLSGWRRFTSTDGAGPAGNEGVGQLLIYADPPVHTRQRRIFSTLFAAENIATLTPYTRAVTNEIIDGLNVAGGVFDSVTDFANPVPMLVTSRLIGVSAERRDDFRRWTEAYDRHIGGDASEPTMAEVKEFYAYLGEFVVERRALTEQPADLTGVLVDARLDGEPFSDDDLVFLLKVFLAAGNATTTGLVVNALWALHKFPSVWDRLLEDPVRVAPLVIEETLRYDGPVQGVFRTAVDDTEVDGVTVPRGTRMYAAITAADHDSEVFPHPDEFDIDRDWRALPPHLAFGFGPHRCVGLHLGRMEATVMLETLIRRVRGLRVATDVAPPQRSGVIHRGCERLPLAYDSVLPRSNIQELDGDAGSVQAWLELSRRLEAPS
jgi:cytochrome P450